MQGRFEIGWQLLVLGMGTVFVMLYLLSVVVKYMGKYFTKQNSKQCTVSGPQNVVHKTKDNNDKIAAIMAAIQVVMGDTDYKILSIKPKGSSTWKQAIQLTGSELTYRGRKEN